MKAVKVWYLYHSSFALQIEDHFLIFDYFNDKSDSNKHSLSSGVIDPNEIKDFKVYVFSSHHHQDHYNSLIFKWRQTIKDITYILSSDIHSKETLNTYYLEPHIDEQIDELRIKTFKSNDEGVAFHISLKGLNLFFSGDLNWWKWEGEDKEWIEGIEKIYFDEMYKLKPLAVDIAFIPVDPRLEKNYALSLDYYSKEIHPESIVFPMHFSDQYEYEYWLKRDGYDKNNNLKNIKHRGEMFKFTI